MAFCCKRCGYSTDVKQNYLKHLRRKKTCPCTLEDISVGVLLTEVMSNKESSHACQYCSKHFNDRSNMYKHMKKCKNDELIKKISEVEAMNEKIKILETQLAEIKTTSHIIQPTITNNNIQNNIVNINLHDFGMESKAHLSREFLNKCFADKGLVDLIGNLHFDKDCPQNHNVRLKSRKQELMEVFTNGKWIVKDQDQTLTELIQSGYRILRMHGRKNKDTILEDEDIDEDDYEEVVQWLESIYEDRQAQKPLKRDLIILFMNNQAMLLGRDRCD